MQPQMKLIPHRLGTEWHYSTGENARYVYDLVDLYFVADICKTQLEQREVVTTPQRGSFELDLAWKRALLASSVGEPFKNILCYHLVKKRPLKKHFVAIL